MYGVDNSSLRPFVEPFDTFEAPASATDDLRPVPADRPEARHAARVLHVERVAALALIRCQTEWADLCKRALEPNIFLEPAFAVPLLQHVPYPKRPYFLLVWEESGPVSCRRLLGLFPIEDCGGSLSLDSMLRGFAHNQTSCGMPLVDRQQASHTIEAVLDWLAAHYQRRHALAFTSIAKEGAFHGELRRLSAASSRSFMGLGEHQRAELRQPNSGGGRSVRFASATLAPARQDPVRLESAKRRKERARQFRRLSEAGTRTYASAKTPTEIAGATERFLALEHNGWKGKRGTALLADPRLATFARTMTRLMAHEGKCRIDSIEIDGKPVAMGIIIAAGGRAHFWKTAFDEAFAPLSPGVQFTMELTQAQLNDPSVVSTDSCAIANHPMIDRLWPDRMTITDVVIGLRPGETGRFARSLGIERLRRAVRHRAKTLWLQMR